MARYHGAPDAQLPAVRPGPEVPADDVSSAGSVVAVVDEPGETSVWLMSVEDCRDGMLHGQYYTATSHVVATAKFRLVWIEDKSGLAIVGKPRANEKAQKWSGCVPDEAARALAMCKDGTLTAGSLRKLRGLSAARLLR